MGGPCRVEHGRPTGDDLVGVPEVDLLRGQHRDAAVPVLGIVPAEERSTERLGLALIPEPPGKRGMVLQGFELSLGKWQPLPQARTQSRLGSGRSVFPRDQTLLSEKGSAEEPGHRSYARPKGNRTQRLHRPQGASRLQSYVQGPTALEA